MSYTVTRPSGIQYLENDPEEKRSCGDCLYDCNAVQDLCELCLTEDMRERPLWELK